MDQSYDVIIIGTGLTECILSGVLSKEGKKVLHLDRNDYYGGEGASMTPLKELFEHFNESLDSEDKYGRGRDWNVDLVSKLMMAHSDLTKLLIHSDVTRYLEFKQIEGSYVYKKGGDVYKVPADDKEALASSLMGIFEKRRFKNFLLWAMNLKFDDPSTHKGVNLETDTPSEVYKKFGLDQNTADFTGHAIALYQIDDYSEKPCKDFIARLKLYYDSLSTYGKSPYLYPLYGLGELPQGFARLSAVYGGTYMLNKAIDELVMEDGKIVGIRSGDETVKAKTVICSPSYAPDRARKISQVVRAICILKHPIAKTANSASFNLIMPANQVARKTDINVVVLGNEQQVSAKDYYLATVSTTVETPNPEAELKLGLDLLAPIEQKFVSVQDVYAPTDDGVSSQIFVTRSYDATSNFQSVTEDVLDIYQRMFGRSFDFDQIKTKVESQ